MDLSRNGTYVNGEKIGKNKNRYVVVRSLDLFSFADQCIQNLSCRRLQDGDVITFHQSKLHRRMRRFFYNSFLQISDLISDHRK